MSHAETKEVTYLDGHRIEVSGRVYAPERECRNSYGGREFECSACGMQWHLLDRADACDEWAHVRTPRFCPNCGAKVVG